MSTATATKPRPAKTAALAPDMHLTINRGEFMRALAHASAIVEKRNTIPVLSNVLLEAAGDVLKITATDLNLQIALNVPCNVEAEGATTVSATMLYSIVRELSDGCQVELKLDENRLQVLSGRSRFKLQVIPRDQFPVISSEDAMASFTAPAADLLRTIARVAVAQSTEDLARPYLCGVNVDAAAGLLTLAATDGNRLAWSSLPAADDLTLEGAILSTKFVSALVKLLDGADGNVTLAFDQRKVTVALGDTALIGKLVEGTFPPWRRVIPTANDKHLLIDPAAIAAAVRRVTLVAQERTSAVKIELTADKLTASCVSPEHGVAVEEVPCAWDSGEFVIGFNSRFLLDLIAVAGEGELQADFADAAAPTLFSNPNDESANWILMPMRV